MVIGFAIEFLQRTSKLKQKSEKMRLVHWQNVGLRKKLVQKHVDYTQSALGEEILKDWEVNKMDFIKVYPTDYRLALERIEQEKKSEKTKLTA